MFRITQNLDEMRRFCDKSTRIYIEINKKDKNSGLFSGLN